MRSCLLMLAAVLLVAGPANADTKVEQARTYFSAGRSAYEAGLYASAIQAFEEAYRLAPRPPVLFSLAQAYRQQYMTDRDPQRLIRAVELFRQYLKEVPKGGRHDHASQHLADLEAALARTDVTRAAMGPRAPIEARTQLMVTSRTPGALAAVDDDEPIEVPLIRDVSPGAHTVRVEADGYIAEELSAVAVDGRLVVTEVNLKEKPAVVALSAPPGAAVSLDGRAVGRAPLPVPLEIPAGRHLISVTDSGRYGWTRELELGLGETIQLEAELETTRQRKLAYAFLSVSGALLAGGSVTGIIALSAEGRVSDLHQQLIDRRGLSREELIEYQDALDRRDRYAPITYALLGGAIAAGTTGLLLYLLD